MAADHITLSLHTLRTVLRRRGVEPHAVFAATVSWHSEHARRRLDAAADEELRALGPATGHRHSGLESALRALDRPRREYFGWVETTFDGALRSYAVLAAQTDRHAVVAVHDHGSGAVVLAAVRADELEAGFAAQIPPYPTSRAATINAPYQEFLQTSARSSASSGVRALQRLFTAPRTGAGNLYSAVRTPGGRKRMKHPVNYIDTADGRWLTVLSQSGGRQWATATPATPNSIIQRLAVAADHLAGAETSNSTGGAFFV